MNSTRTDGAEWIGSGYGRERASSSGLSWWVKDSESEREEGKISRRAILQGSRRGAGEIGITKGWQRGSWLKILRDNGIFWLDGETKALRDTGW